MIATVTLNPSLDEWIQLPSLRMGALNRAGGFARYPGGKGINVSRVVRELGGRTLALAFAGGEDGLILRELMNRLRIPHTFVSVRGATRNNYKIRTLHPPTLTEINTAGPRVSSADVRAFERLLFRLAPAPRCVALSGSLPPGVPASMYRRWIGRLGRHNIPVALDASGAALREGIRAHPWLIKPNRQEAEELLGRRLTRVRHVVQAAQHLLRMGPSVVVLSLGRQGAVMAYATASDRGVWMARPPSVTVRSAVGAGDSLVGGFLTGWVNGLTLHEAFRLGVACGTAAAMTSGTELCRRADVTRIARQVLVRRAA